MFVVLCLCSCHPFSFLMYECQRPRDRSSCGRARGLVQMPVYRSVDSAIAAVEENRVSIIKLQTGAPIGAKIIDLVDALKKNTSLKRLTLDGQSISAEGAESLAEYLALNPRLEHLGLFNNSIGPAGAASLAASLASNRKLSDLDLGDNGVGDAGAAALAQAMRRNRSVSYVRLHNDGIGPSGAAALAGMLKHVHTLQEMCLYGNAIGDAGAVSIGAALGQVAGRSERVVEHYGRRGVVPVVMLRSRVCAWGSLSRTAGLSYHEPHVAARRTLCGGAIDFCRQGWPSSTSATTTSATRACWPWGRASPATAPSSSSALYVLFDENACLWWKAVCLAVVSIRMMSDTTDPPVLLLLLPRSHACTRRPAILSESAG
jgi:hypothetical protein